MNTTAAQASERKRVVPIDVIESEARKLNAQLDAKSLLLGYAIGRQPDRMFDETHLRRLVRTMLGARHG